MEQLLKRNNMDLLNIFDDFRYSLNELGFIESKHRVHNYEFEYWVNEIDKKRICFLSVNYIKEGNEYRISGMHSFIVFEQVDKILRQFVNLDSEFFGFVFDSTINDHPAIDKNLNGLFQFSRNPINTIEEFSLVKEKIIEYTKLHILPFFDKVPNLQVVNDEIINKVSQMELGDYIPGWYCIYKKQIIMKLCNNPNYDEYVQWLDKSFKEDVKNEPDKYLKEYEMFQDLTAYLASGKYKEII